MTEATIVIKADSDQAHQALTKLADKVQNLDEKFLGLGAAAKGLSAALSIGVVAELVKSSFEAADQMGKLAQKAGISTESLSQLSIAARLSDIDTQTLAQGLGKLSKSMVEAQSGSGAAADAYKALGINVKDSNGQLKSADDVLKEVADKFQDTEDGAGKTAAAMAIFGKAGADLIPMLNGGSEELDKFAKLSDQLGLTLDGPTAKAAQDVKDKFTIMGMAIQGVGMNVMRNMLPTFEALSDVLVDAATDTESLQRKADVLSFALKGIVSIGMGVAQAFDMVGKTIGALVASLSSLGEGGGIFTKEGRAAFSGVWKEFSADMDSDIASFSARMDKLWAEREKKREEGAKPKKGKINLDGGTGANLDKEVLALQNAELLKYNELMGISAAQTKLQELAAKGATPAQLALAKAAVDATDAWTNELRVLKEQQEALKHTEKSTYELQKAHEASIATLVDLQLREQLRQADMLVGLDRERETAAIQLEMITSNLAKQRDAQIAALDEKRRIDMQNKALTLELELAYQQQRAQIVEEFEAKDADARAAAAANRLKNEVSVANFSANIRAGDYSNAMTIAEKMTSGLASHSRAMFEMNKVASLANATIKGYSSIVNAFEEGSKWGGWWGGAAMAALATAFVVTQLDAINSTQFSGGGGNVPGSSGGGGGIPSFSSTPGTPVNNVGAAATAAAPRTQMNITLVGNSIDYDTFVNEFIPALQQASNNGAIDISVNRT